MLDSVGPLVPLTTVIPSTWEDVAVPILERVGEAENDGRDLSLDDLAAGLRASPGAIRAELLRLIDGEFIGGEVAGEMGNSALLSLEDPVLLERGARAIGKWPSEDAYDELLAVLDDHIAKTPDDDTRSKLGKLRETLGAVGKGEIGRAHV